MATGMFENEPSGSCLQTQQPPGVPDSPDSIPLPDSPPPEAEDLGGVLPENDPEPDLNQDDPDGHNNNIETVTNNMPPFSSSSNSGSSTGKSSRKKESRRKPRLTEEYDPSEPLTSSDEEEHSLQLIETGSEKGSGRGASQKNERNRNLVGPKKSPSPPPRQFLMPSSPPQTRHVTSPIPVVSGKPAGEVRSLSVTSSSSNSLITNSSGSSINTIPSGGSIRLDLNSIPVPPDESRRPVIHFSIPTRHRLLPISSLMKRQKNSLRKDGRDGGGQLGDGSKGVEKGLEGDDDDEEDDLDDLSRPKISLVAEIFGGTDDEDDVGENETDAVSQPQGNGQAEDSMEFDSHADSDSRNAGFEETVQADGGASRWKIVADEPVQNEVLMQNGGSEMNVVTSDKGLSNIESNPVENEEVGEGEGGDEPEIIEIVTLNVPPTSRYRPLRRRPLLGRLGLENGGEPEVIDIDDKDDDPVGKVREPVRESSKSSRDGSGDRHHRRSSPPPRRPSPVEREISGNNENDRERRRSRTPTRDSPVRPERHFKRPHSSSSMSNCEEGEIVDQYSPSKKRKKDKKKKTKRRKRSKSGSPPPSTSSSKLPEKRLSDSGPPPESGSENEDNGKGSGGAISWRKPSKRTQNRNYRDGKPKADDTFFQERKADEKQKSSSPSHRRAKPSTRKERSPVKEKSAGSSSRHRRDTSPKNNRSHSKSPDRRSRLSRSRSRSSGRAYRGRRRYRHSRSKSSNSASDKSRSGRSSSRRRSRRRYRRSTSRHHAGDSRSPSYITEPIRSRSSHYSKLRDRSRTRSRDRHTRARHRNKRSITRSRSPSPRSHKRGQRPESVDRQRKKQPKEKEKEKPVEPIPPDHKDKKKEKEKLKEKEKRTKRKEKEKPKEEDKNKVKEKEKPKEKEKKKKKKRREKSPTPVKAIVADGDRLVVSLSFQKGKSTSSAISTYPSSASVEERNENGLKDSKAESPSKAKPVAPIKSGSGDEPSDKSKDFHAEQDCPRSSPIKLSSVTDEDSANAPRDHHHLPNSAEGSVKPGSSEEKDIENIKVTSSGGALCGSNSPFEPDMSFSAAADSTKTVTPVPNEQNDSSRNHSIRSSMSPTTDGESNAQGDSMVTSTGDSIDTNTHGAEDEAKTNTSSTPSKQLAEGNRAPKIVASNASPRHTMQSSSSATLSSETLSTSSSSMALPIPVVNTVISTNIPQPVTPVASRPLIGNIPGLYPSSAIINTGGAAPVPPPIVIPTPPPPRAMAFSNAASGPSPAPMLNANVLASVASALFAVRQNQPNFNAKMQAASGNGDSSSNMASQRHNVNSFSSKPQTFPFQSNFRGGLSNNSFSQGQDQGGGGESPMSPNSSDGDDLFEPPMDGGKGGKNGQGFGNVPSGPSSDNNNTNESFNSAGSGKSKERSTLFDSLFGGPAAEPKKPSSSKPEKASKSKVKHRKGGPKKETIKVNTSGGMTEGELRLTDEVPTSAVELIVKQKYLKKLNRQERVVEEVKLALKPYYSKRQVNKDEYKEILRRAVPKICHNKTGEINPGKIKELVDAYVKKFRHARKRGLDLSSVK